MPNSTILKTLTLSDGTYNNTLPIEDTTARNSITSLANSLAPVATSGSYNDLTGKLTAGTGISINGNVISATGVGTETMEVSFQNENDTWTCSDSIEEICEWLDNNIRVIAKVPLFGYFIMEPLAYSFEDGDGMLAIGIGLGGNAYVFNGQCNNYVDSWSLQETNVVDWDTYSSGMGAKQDTLVSGSNIKTINGQSLLGSGNISIQGSGGGEANVIETVKVNGTALPVDSNKAVDITEIPWSIVTNKPTIPDVSGKADKVSGGVSGHIAELDANGNLADGGVLASDVEDAVTKKHTHSNKAYLDKIPSSNGTNGQVLTSDGTAWSWQTPSSGGLTNYDYTHTASTFQSGTVAVTFAANQRCSVMYGASADFALAITCNNGADNYIWVQNTGTADIDITISSVVYNNTSLAASKIFLPSDGITVPKGCVCEIGVLCNADGAFITARGDLKASS